MKDHTDRWHVIKNIYVKENHVVGQHMTWDFMTEDHIEGWHMTENIITEDHSVE